MRINEDRQNKSDSRDTADASAANRRRRQKKKEAVTFCVTDCEFSLFI
jgi:hypothetical protein